MARKVSKSLPPVDVVNAWEDDPGETIGLCDKGDKPEEASSVPSEQLVLRRQLYTQSLLDKVYQREWRQLQTPLDAIKSKCRNAPRLAARRALSYLPIVQRQLYTQSLLDKVYQREWRQLQTPLDAIKSKCRNAPRLAARRALSYLPIVQCLKTYRWRQWILADVISGLSAGFIHLPQGLGYGILASLTPVYGLYTSFFPILVYLLFGTSPHVSMGTNAVVALLTANLVSRELDAFQATLGANQTLSELEQLEYKVSIATASCFIGGLIMLAMGVMRLGFLTNFLSKSFIGGFTFAAAVHITTSQIVKMMRLSLPGRSGNGRLIMTYIDLFKNIGDTNPGDVIVGLISMAVLLAVNLGINERFKHKMKVPIPIELIVVIISTIISHFAKLHDQFGIAVVGNVPAGIPAPTVPRMDSLSLVASDAFVTTILIYALTITLAKLTAKLQEITIDDNQELVAYGLCNLVGAFFLNFPACTAPPRTMILNSLGAKSTLNGVMSALFILLVLLVLGQLFVSLPIAMLAAMIIVAMKDLLLQIRHLKSLWYINKNDFYIWILTAVFSVFGDLDIGLLVGVVFSMVTVLAVSQLAKGRLLGKADHEDIIVELDRKGISSSPGVKIFRFEAALYFASQERFKKQIYRQVLDPSTVTRKELTVEVASKEPAPEGSPDLDNNVIDLEKTPALYIGASNTLSYLILDCSALTYIDASGLDMLQMVMTQFSRAGVEVWLASVPRVTLATLTRAGITEKMGADKVFYSVTDALKRIQRSQGTGNKL